MSCGGKLNKVELSSIFIDWPPRGGAAAAGGRGGGRPRDAGHRLQQPPPGSLRCGQPSCDQPSCDQVPHRTRQEDTRPLAPCWWRPGRRWTRSPRQVCIVCKNNYSSGRNVQCFPIKCRVCLALFWFSFISRSELVYRRVLCVVIKSAKFIKSLLPSVL